jgi:hypothetical protein
MGKGKSIRLETIRNHDNMKEANMLNEPTMQKLYAMKLNGLAEAYEEQRRQPKMASLSFDERFAMLVERQWIWKENRALATRLRHATLKEQACIGACRNQSPDPGSALIIPEAEIFSIVRQTFRCRGRPMA